MEETLSEPVMDIITNSPILRGKHQTILERTLEFQTLMMMYNSAIREVTTKFEILNDDLAMKNKRNPIESMSQRVKSPVSITNKLQKLKLPITADSIYKNLNDVAGVRIVCSFVDDIYLVAEMLSNQNDVTVIQIKDYIKNPKPNGYRSYHMIVEVPVYFSDSSKDLRVEVQFRTIAMDLWASLEHQLKYKKRIENEEEIYERLQICATIISKVDDEMLSIRKQIDESSDEDEEDVTSKLEKLSNGLLKYNFF